MPDPISTAVAAFLGEKALDVIGAAVKDHVKDHLKHLLSAAEKKLLGKKEEDALALAYESVLTHAYTRTFDALGWVLEGTGVTFPEFLGYQISIENFLKNKDVASHLLETVRDLSNSRLPDPQVLDTHWKCNGGRSLPFPGVWNMVAANFRKNAREKVFVTPAMREILNAQNIDQLVQLQQKLLGVQIIVRHEQYVSRMLKKYAPVELANLAPSYAESPGVLVVTDIFEPQHVRENPPPVDITKDEFEKLVREGKLDRNDKDAVIAQLEEDGGVDATQRFRFQRASYAEQPVRPVLDVVRIPPGASSSLAQRNRLLVITGEPGSGKSTLLRYLLLGVLNPPRDPRDRSRPLAWTEGFTGEHEHFPLLIELRDYYFTCQAEKAVNSFLDYVQYLGETQGYGIDAEWLDKRLRDGPSLVLFDGLDEIFDAGDRDKIMQQIVGFAETYSQARVIVTSRPHGYHESILRPAGFAHYRLQDLDRNQMATFTRAWFGRVFPDSTQDAGQRIARVLDSIDRSASVRWLAGNPLLLTIMCLIARDKELPRERARFYEECLDVLAHKWDINRHLQDERLAFLDVDDKKDLLRRIAFHMQSSTAGLRGNFIAEGELLALTQGWFEETFTDHKGAQARLAAQQMIKGLWERNYLLCPRGPKLYGFLHRTFMEFLTATEYVRRFEKTPEFTLDDLDAVFREHGNEPEWAEVLRLICGEIGDEYADKLIRTLLTLKKFPTQLLTKENQPNHLVLGVRCMSELRGFSKMEDLAIFAFERCVQFLQVLNAAISQGKKVMNGDLLQAVIELSDRWRRKQIPILDRNLFNTLSASGRLLLPELFAAMFRDRSSIAAITQVNAQTSDFQLRWSALRALAKWWPDLETRHVLSQSAVEDDLTVRSQALELLARHEPWADETTRQLVTQRALQDGASEVQSKALELLAGHEPWADESTRQLVTQRAVQDASSEVRSKALELLAGHEPWADEPTRQLLTQRVVQDEDNEVRSSALELLARHEPWAAHDETLTMRHRFLEQIRDAARPEERGAAACAWFGTVGGSDPRANAKKRVFSTDAYGNSPFLDPRKRVSDEHLAKVASRAGLSKDQIDKMVEEMNATLGWDIRKGLDPISDTT